MRYFLPLVTFLLLLFSGCRSEKASPADASYASIDTLPMLIMQVKDCSRLYTTEYQVHKIVTHEDVVRLQGKLLNRNIDMRLPLGDRKIAIPMDATLKAYIDFSDFSEANIERDGERIVVTLPDPKVELTSTKIDQKAVREYVSLARAHFSDAEMSSYEQQGRDAILESVPSLGILERAEADAARVLIPLFVQMGFDEKNVTVTYRKTFGRDDIKRLLEPSNR